MLTFKTITAEDKCKRLWDKFSAKKGIWDLWDFRHCFHTPNFRLNFILGMKDGEEIGIIPVVYDVNDRDYVYFGGGFPERNKIMIRDKGLLPDFLENCPKETFLYYIDASESYCDFEEGDKRYFLMLGKYGHDFSGYLATFNKKHRKNLNYDLKKLKETGYSLVLNDFNDFGAFMEMSKARFGIESDYNDADFVGSMQKAIDLARKMGILEMISARIKGKTEAVGIGIMYNGYYYVLGNARNAGIKNLGKLLISEQIKSAILKKCDEIDFLSTESNWKELWNLESEQMLEYQKPIQARKSAEISAIP